MPKKKTCFDVDYVENDLSETMSEESLRPILMDAHASRLLQHYENGNHSAMAACLIEMPIDASTLGLLIEYAIAQRLATITAKAADEKYQKSGYLKLKAQVLAFFHAEAHRRDDKTAKPIYKSKSAFLNAAFEQLCPELKKGQQLNNRTMANWLEDVRSSFPTHWLQPKK